MHQRILEMEKTAEALVSFTNGALTEIRRMIATEPNKSVTQQPLGLRLGVEGGGCAGMSYTLAFDNFKEKDLEFEVEGIPVFMNKAHSLYLSGMQVDYLDGLNARGFTFANPNAQSTCGCGSSFGV